MGQSGLLGLLDADVGLVAGRAQGGDVLQTQVAGCTQKVELIDGQRRQVLQGIEGVVGGDLLDQPGLAQGDAIGGGQLLELVVGGYGLTEDRAVKGLGLQQSVDLFGQLCLQGGGHVRILGVYADENGIGQFVQIPVAQHGTDEGVDGDVQTVAGKVHVAQDDPAVLVVRHDRQHALPPVDLDFHTGIDVQGHGGGHGVIGVVLMQAHPAPRQQQQGGGRACGPPGPLGHGPFLGQDRHFCGLPLTAGKDGVQGIRRGVGKRLADFVLYILFFHVCRSPFSHRV